MLDQSKRYSQGNQLQLGLNLDELAYLQVCIIGPKETNEVVDKVDVSLIQPTHNPRSGRVLRNSIGESQFSMFSKSNENLGQ